MSRSKIGPSPHIHIGQLAGGPAGALHAATLPLCLLFDSQRRVDACCVRRSPENGQRQARNSAHRLRPHSPGASSTLLRLPLANDAHTQSLHLMCSHAHAGTPEMQAGTCPLYIAPAAVAMESPRELCANPKSAVTLRQRLVWSHLFDSTSKEFYLNSHPSSRPIL